MVAGEGSHAGNITTAKEIYTPTIKALAFDGVTSDEDNGRIDLRNPTQYNLTTGTIEAWINTANAGSSYRGIVTKALAYGLFLRDNMLVAYDWTAGEINTGITLNDSKWHHVALSFAANVTNGSQIYLDGVAVGPAFTYKINDNTLDATIGGASNETTQNFNGIIDEVRIWNEARTAAQISNYATTVIGGVNTDADTTNNLTTLVGYYPLDETGNQVNDYSGKANNVTLPSAGVSPILVDMLGYRVNSSGAFVSTVGTPLSSIDKPVYEGTPVMPVSGGSIRSGSFKATANAGAITLDGSIYPANSPAVTAITTTVASFSDTDDQFTINAHGLSTGTKVRFHGVREGCLLPLVDGGLYYVISTGANTFKLAGTEAEANAGTALALSLASTVTAGTLATFSPQLDLGDSSVSLSAGTVAIRGNIQTQTLGVSASS
jgi:hypothetical protein